MNRSLLVSWVVEALRENPERCVLWVIEGSEGVLMWDLLKPGDAPQWTKGQWTFCGLVHPQDDPARITALIDTAIAKGRLGGPA